APKRLEVLHELVPAAKIIALFVDPTDPVSEKTRQGVQAAAQRLGLELHVLNVSTEQEFEAIFAKLVQLQAGGLVISGGSILKPQSQPARVAHAPTCGANDFSVSRRRC